MVEAWFEKQAERMKTSVLKARKRALSDCRIWNIETNLYTPRTRAFRLISIGGCVFFTLWSIDGAISAIITGMSTYWSFLCAECNFANLLRCYRLLHQLCTFCSQPTNWLRFRLALEAFSVSRIILSWSQQLAYSSMRHCSRVNRRTHSNSTRTI